MNKIICLISRAFWVLILLFMLSSVTVCAAMDVTLTWNANQEPDLAGYKIYYGTSSGDYNPAPADYVPEYSIGNDPTKISWNKVDPIEVGRTVTKVIFYGLTEKVYYFSIRAFDGPTDAGGAPLDTVVSGEGEATEVATGDNQAPEITILEVNGVGGATQIYTNAADRQVAVRIVANDDGTVTEYLIQDDNGTMGGSFQAVASPGSNVDFTVSFALDNVDKNRTIYAWVKDNLASTGAASKANVWLDRTSPTSIITSPANGDYVNDATLTSITGTSSDGSGCGVANVEIQVTDGTNYLQADDNWTTIETWFTPDGGTVTDWDHNVSGVTFSTDTQYTVRSRATDNATNLQTTPTQISFTYDTTLPTGNISYSASDFSHVDVGTLTITATFSEALDGAPNITIDMPNPMLTIGPAAMSPGGSAEEWTYNLVIQTHDGTATATDGASLVTVHKTSIVDLAQNNASEDLVSNFTTDTIDTDNDGTRDYEDDDDDDDGMPDTFENQYGFLDPLDSSDADDDEDVDGYTNKEEYDAGTQVNNKGPDQPVLDQPANVFDPTVSLTPELTTQAYNDNEDDTHAKTRWQICRDNSFAGTQLVFDFKTTDHLEALSISGSILDPDTTYFWRVMFFDSKNGPSLWADEFSFKTQSGAASGDKNGDGVPDDQAIADGTVDLDSDGSNDNFSTTYRAVNTVIGDAQIGVKASTNVTSVDALKSVDPGDLPGKPDNFLIGLIDLKVTVSAPNAQVTVYLSKAAPEGAAWWKYSLINGWQNFTDLGYAIFSDDKTSLTLTLTDGGVGDADGVENGVIVDPSGPSGSSGGVTVDSSGGGCFIATAAYGSPLDKHVDILRRLRDNILLPTKWGQGFAKAYYRYSPPVADFIRDHDTARLMARWSLLPVVGLSWVALQIGAVPTLLVLMAGLIMVFWIIGRKFARVYAD